MDNYGEIIIYQTEDGLTKLDVRMEDETVWLTQQQMAELFQTSRTNVVDHIKNIYEEGELDENSTCRKFRQVRMEGNRQVTRELPFYNLDMIISLGYRVKSSTATHFRKWATQRLKEYIIKGFTIDDERLKGNGGGNYWKELPALKDIGVAKNYLKEDELKILNNLVSGYFDLAEINAIEHKPMYMADYVEQLDSILSSGNRKLLVGPGKVSHDQAIKKAKEEYRKYQEITLSPVEEEYLKSIRGVEKEVKKRSRTKK